MITKAALYGLVAALICTGSVQAQIKSPTVARGAEYHSPVSDAQLNAVAATGRRRPYARKLIEALRRGDQNSAADILRQNGAPPPPNTLIKLGSGPIISDPNDICFTVERRIEETPKGIIETWTIRQIKC